MLNKYNLGNHKKRKIKMGMFKSLYNEQKDFELNLLQAQDHENIEKHLIEVAQKIVDHFNKVSSEYRAINFGQNVAITYQGIAIVNIILHEDDDQILILNYKGDYLAVFENAVRNYKKIDDDINKIVYKAIKEHPETSNIANWQKSPFLHMQDGDSATENVTAQAQKNIAAVNDKEINDKTRMQNAAFSQN